MMNSIPTWNRCVLLLLVAIAAYFQTWSDLWPFWENKNATYTHGSLIALIALWLVWRSRTELRQLAPVAELRALPVVLGLSALWLLAARANFFILHAMLWPVLAFSILWSGTGWQAAKKMAFPLAFLYFAIPFWDYLKPPLQAVASTMVGSLTNLVGVQAVVDGPYITVPSGTIYIALDCSGAHFLSVALAVGVLAGEFRGDTVRTRLLILLMAGLLSMVFNWLRILLIVFAYLDDGLRHSLETMGHLTFGWWVFAFDLVVFYLALRLVPLSAAADPTSSTHTATAAPMVPKSPGFALTMAAAVLLPGSSLLAREFSTIHSDTVRAVSIPDMAGPLSPDARWQPTFNGAAWESRAAYVWKDGRVMELYRNEFHDQSQGKELISNGSLLFDPSAFEIGTIVPVSLSRGSVGLQASRAVLTDRSDRHWLALFTYVIDDRTVANPREAQLRMALDSLFDRPAAGVFAVALPCTGTCEEISSSLDDAAIRAFEAFELARRMP